MFKPDDILKNLVPDQEVKVTSCKLLSGRWAIQCIGLDGRKELSVVKTEAELAGVEVIGSEGRADFSGDSVGFKLWIESKRIQTAFQFDPLFAVNCSIVDPLPHQVEAVYSYLLPLPTIRFLLADDTGAGKTIMTGLLLKELLSRELISRVLIITPGGLTKQWQEDEMQGKFNLDFTLVDRARFKAEPNVFATAGKVVTSMDFIRSEDVMNTIDGLAWDMVVVDECHKLSKFNYGSKEDETKRYQAVKVISEKTEHLLLLTATPHRGRMDTFKYLLQLLDPDIFSTDKMVQERIQDLALSGTNRFFIRRLKESMVDWDRKPLFKPRFAETTAYELTPREKELYDAVTEYLTVKREQADQNRNTHVTLTLLVMQRRLTSSLYAIDKTLGHRVEALSKVLSIVRANPRLLENRYRRDEELDIEADGEEWDASIHADLEEISSDPRQLRYFTTANSIEELEAELDHVNRLYALSQALRNSQHEEAKLTKLKELIQGRLLNEALGGKLVIFTEHRDTLEYLAGVISSQGFFVQTIHGGKSVDERREAQRLFRQAPDQSILVATDAAGEGINLQFCRLLINWDIPWNPNRLEQRMGRIHRYGQEHDVYVFNLVAHNTREGQVLERLLQKLDTIREQMGSDKVYDVISDVFEGVSMDKILSHFLLGQQDANVAAVIDERLSRGEAERIIRERDNRFGHSEVMYNKARALKEASDEQRLQPRFVESFFQEAMAKLGGAVEEVEPYIFRVKSMPALVQAELRASFASTENYAQSYICFDKQVFLQQRMHDRYDGLEFINPGNKLFDALCRSVQNQFRSDMLRGARFVDPEASEGYLAWVVESVINDGRAAGSVADARVSVIRERESERDVFSPSALVDLRPPVEYAKESAVAREVDAERIVGFAFEEITVPQLAETKARLKVDLGDRREHLVRAFEDKEFWLLGEVAGLQPRLLTNNPGKASEQISKYESELMRLAESRRRRLEALDKQLELSPEVPRVLGCAHVMALSEQEYESSFGMKRDDEVEQRAMAEVMAYEVAQGRKPEDVSKKKGCGYDVLSTDPATGSKRYIEVKGRAQSGDVMLSENEWCRLGQLGETAWLYIVTQVRGEDGCEMVRIQNPAESLAARKLSKGVQYLVPENEWKSKAR